MRNIASRSFKIALYATVALIVAAAGLTLALELLRPGADRLPFLNFELGLFKAILAGFVVSMLGILIPAVASEARQPEAVAALQSAHFHKHQAELFDEFPEWLEKRYGADMTALRWDEMMYGRLFCARQALEQNAEAWDRLSPAQRIALLDRALPTTAEIAAERLPCAPR